VVTIFQTTNRLNNNGTNRISIIRRNFNTGTGGHARGSLCSGH
jgi:hypothetical protein